MTEMDRLYAGFRKAKELGETDKMQRIGAYIRQMESQQSSPEATPPVDPEAERKDLYDANVDDMSIMERGLVGAGKVANDAVVGVKDLYYGVTGQDEKRVALNEQADEEDAMYAELSDRSTAAKVGNVLGEVGLGVATALPLSGAYAGVKAAQVAGKVSKIGAGARVAGLLAAEGAAVEGVRNRGDALDRMIDAGEGAALNITGQGVMTLAGKSLGAVKRRMVTKAGKEAFDTVSNHADQVANLKKTAAIEDGGYVLDDVDAYVDRAGLARRDALRRESSPEGVSLQQRHATAERGVTNKAQELVEGAVGDGSRQPLNARTDAFAESLREIRADDWKGVDAAYDAWRSTPEAASVKLDTSTIEKPIRALLEDSKITANGGVNGKLSALLTKYGVLGSTSKETTEDIVANEAGVLERKLVNKALEPDVPLTAANYEQLIIDINSLHGNGNNVASKRLIGQVRDLLEESKYDMLARSPGASEDAIALGEAARSTRKAFAAKWEQGDIVDRLTSLKPGTEEYRQQPVDAVKALMAPKNLDKLKKVKNIVALSKKPEHKQFLADIQAAPLFDAMDKALSGTKTAAGGVPMFSDNTFMKEIRKFSDDQLKALYGDDFVSKIGKAERAWKLREATPNWQSNANPSGTAETGKHLTAAGLRLASTRGGGSDILAAIPMLAGVKDLLAKSATTKDMKALLNGTLPAISKDIREETFERIIREAYPNPQFTQYDSVFSGLARHLARSYENKEFDK